MCSFYLQPELPKVIDEDEDDEEEEEEFQEQNHSLIDYVELKLVSPEEIQKHQQPWVVICDGKYDSFVKSSNSQKNAVKLLIMARLLLV